MDKKLLIIQAAALAHEFEIEGLRSHTAQSVFPAVTCSVQGSFRTASLPAVHGMVANGLFFRNLMRPMFWEQSARLVQGQRIWEDFRSRGKRVALLFWQQSLGEDVDIILSPAPIHKHHGGMIQGCYCRPSGLYEELCRRIGRAFNLRHYWGPFASRKVGEWIVEATEAVMDDPDLSPHLCLTYLPTLDYDLQREDPETGHSGLRARAALEQQLIKLLRAASARGYDVLIFGDYRISPVREAVKPNQALLQEGFMSTRAVGRMHYPDYYKSRAFALVDHEIAHVYVSREEDTDDIKKFLAALPGVEKVLDRETQAEFGLDHPNSGELVLIAGQGRWFAYPWWTDKREAPDYASHVDIHNKPGYDPCELFFGWPPGSVSQHTERIHGSHGRIGPGREITWAATFSMPEAPADLIELAEAVRLWLNERK